MSASYLAWALAVRTVTLSPDPSETVRIRCPVHETTHIVLPEPLRQLRASAEDKAALGIKLERTKPTAALAVRPTSHPLKGRLEFRGPSRVIRLMIETTAAGPASEVRLVMPPPATDPAPTAVTLAALLAPAPEPSPEPTPEAASPPPVPAPTPVAAAPTPTPEAATPPPVAAPESVGSGELVWAKPLAIGRREGLPGQPAMILVDALSGRESIWFRFRLEGGGAERVSAVAWEHGEVTTFQQEADGKDRRIVVRLPKGRVTPRTRLSLSVESGLTYRFALNAPTLSNALRSLFP